MQCRFLLAVGLFALGSASPADRSAVRFEAAKETTLVMEIENRGKLVIELHTKDAPKACEHILGLTRRKFYDGQRFFNVVRKPRPFLIQFGDPGTLTKPITDETLGKGGTGAKIPYEDSGHRHVRGAVGLSRLPDDKNSGDCQFYIMLGTYGFLDGNYTVFGQVTEGLDLLDTIEKGDKVTRVSLQ